mmetsp:Transcript_35178/g.83009  ORF Transcript_35178/g.83009 Transcript_35178/m.83009 type:complete len:238 (-) Transcript_35178:264-977(-)
MELSTSSSSIVACALSIKPLGIDGRPGKKHCARPAIPLSALTVDSVAFAIGITFWHVSPCIVISYAPACGIQHASQTRLRKSVLTACSLSFSNAKAIGSEMTPFKVPIAPAPRWYNESMWPPIFGKFALGDFPVKSCAAVLAVSLTSAATSSNTSCSGGSGLCERMTKAVGTVSSAAAWMHARRLLACLSILVMVARCRPSIVTVRASISLTICSMRLFCATMTSSFFITSMLPPPS